MFDNVLIAKHCRTHTNFLAAALRLNRKEEAEQRRHVEITMTKVQLFIHNPFFFFIFVP